MMASPRCSRQRSTGGRGRRPSTAPPQVLWAGLDVAKATFEAAVAPRRPVAGSGDPLAGMAGRGFERTRQDASRFLAWAYGLLPPGTRLAVVMEATGRYSKELAAWLREADDSLDVVIADPRKIHHFGQSLGTRNNTDKVDARVIARFGVERTPRVSPEPAPDYERLRELTRERRRLVDERVRLENRRSEATPLDLIKTQWKERLDLLNRQEQALDAEIEALTRKSELLRRDNKAMREIPGVGPVVSSPVQAEAGDPRRFPTVRAFVAYCGLAPEKKESGTSVRRSKRSKRGSARLRQVLYLAAMAALRAKKPSRFHAYRDRRTRKGLATKGTMLGIQRKILTAIYCTSTREVPCDDTHRPTWNPKGGKKETTRHSPSLNLTAP